MAEDIDTITLTAEIVAAYAAGNKIKAEELPALISSVHGALSSAGQPEIAVEPETSKPTTSQIKKSISHDALISFVDGKSYKSLKRHLSTQGMSPDEYRSKYGLPRDYPMVAPSYSLQRSELAKKLGLGNKRVAAAPAPEPQPEPKPEATPAPKRGRRKQAEQAQQAQRETSTRGEVRSEDEEFT